MSTEYPCIYFEKDGKCRKFSDDTYIGYCVMGPCPEQQLSNTEANNADINSVCFGILCNFTPVCGEERAKEAVATVRSLQAENKKLYELIGGAQKLLHAYQDVIVPDYKKCIEQLEKEQDDAVVTLEESRLR